MAFPLSRDEYTALARVLSGVRKQLQDVSDLFSTRYGKDSSLAEIAVKTLVSTTLLEHEFLQLNAGLDTEGVNESETESKSLGQSSY